MVLDIERNMLVVGVSRSQRRIVRMRLGVDEELIICQGAAQHDSHRQRPDGLEERRLLSAEALQRVIVCLLSIAPDFV